MINLVTISLDRRTDNAEGRYHITRHSGKIETGA